MGTMEPTAQAIDQELEEVRRERQPRQPTAAQQAAEAMERASRLAPKVKTVSQLSMPLKDAQKVEQGDKVWLRLVFFEGTFDVPVDTYLSREQGGGYF